MKSHKRTDGTTFRLLGLLLIGTLPLLMAQGCPPEEDVNNAPIANAGNDQSVTGGDTVNLNGSASSDPDGDTLTFLWLQTAGTQVGLTGRRTPRRSSPGPGARRIARPSPG